MTEMKTSDAVLRKTEQLTLKQLRDSLSPITEKYSEDQPRDELGRFGEGGGGNDRGGGGSGRFHGMSSAGGRGAGRGGGGGGKTGGRGAASSRLISSGGKNEAREAQDRADRAQGQRGSIVQGADARETGKMSNGDPMPKGSAGKMSAAAAYDKAAEVRSEYSNAKPQTYESFERSWASQFRDSMEVGMDPKESARSLRQDAAERLDRWMEGKSGSAADQPADSTAGILYRNLTDPNSFLSTITGRTDYKPYDENRYKSSSKKSFEAREGLGDLRAALKSVSTPSPVPPGRGKGGRTTKKERPTTRAKSSRVTETVRLLIATIKEAKVALAKEQGGVTIPSIRVEMPPQAPPVVNIAAPPPANVTVQAAPSPVVNVAAPHVTVQPPNVNVQPPAVNLTLPQPKLIVEEDSRPRRASVRRDGEGNITEIVTED